MSSKRITPEMVSEAMGIPVQTLRVALQHEAFSFGIAFKRPGCKRHNYLFYPGILKEYLGEEIYNKMMGC